DERRNGRDAARDIAPAAAVVDELPADREQRVARRSGRHVLGPPDARRDVAANEAAENRQQRGLRTRRSDENQFDPVPRRRRTERRDADRRGGWRERRIG